MRFGDRRHLKGPFAANGRALTLVLS